MVKIDATASDFDKQDNRVLCCSLLQHMHHKKAVAARYQCNVWILGRHEAHLAVLSTGADTSVSVVADVDAVSFCWSWTSDSSASPELLLSAAPHMTSVYDEMMWLTACRNCRRVYAWVSYRCRHVFMRLSLTTLVFFFAHRIAIPRLARRTFAWLSIRLHAEGAQEMRRRSGV